MKERASKTLKQKISPRNKEYLAYTAFASNMQERDFYNENHSFAIDTIREVRRIEKVTDKIRLTFADKSKDELDKAVGAYRGYMWHYFLASTREFIRRAQKRPAEAERFLRNILWDKNIREALLPHAARLRTVLPYLNPGVSSELRSLTAVLTDVSEDFIDRVYTLIVRRKIPEEVWFSMLEKNAELVMEARDTFHTLMLPQMKKSFLERAKEISGFRSAILPEYSLIEQKLQEQIFQLEDAFDASINERHGYYSSPEKLSMITSAFSRHDQKPQLYHVFVHEVFHALSGHTIIEKTREVKVQKQGMVSYSNSITYDSTAIGFRKSTYSKGGFGTWFNEAMTEYLTSYFLQTNEKRYYAEEQALLEYVATGGKITIPMEDFAQAYFEDYDPTQKPTIPKWRTLRSKINESFGHEFLPALDALVRKMGAKKALQFLQTGGVEALLQVKVEGKLNQAVEKKRL
jgi:hypothetical protein